MSQEQQITEILNKLNANGDINNMMRSLADLRDAVSQNPLAVDRKAFEVLARIVFPGIDREILRPQALDIMGDIFEKRPDLADHGVMGFVAEISCTNLSEGPMYKATKRTLGILSQKRPNLAADAALVTMSHANNKNWRCRYMAQVTAGLVIEAAPSTANYFATTLNKGMHDNREDVRIAAEIIKRAIAALKSQPRQRPATRRRANSPTPRL